MTILTATVTPELIDVDVCFYSFDGHTTRYTWVVEYFVDGAKIDEHCLKTEEYARMCAGMFEQGDYSISEYGGVWIPGEPFQDEIMTLLLDGV